MGSAIPNHIITDRYWKGLIHLFTHCDKLQHYFTSQYFDVYEGTVDSSGLKRISRPWSNSERFMLQLALHLYNERNQVNLSDMDYLDPKNKKLAMEAIQMRFS